jgi:anti-sigma factor RsiW
MQEFLFRLRFWRDHRWAPGRMSEYLDGELTARSKTRMERHVHECRECRRLVGGLVLVLEALHGLPSPEGGGDPLRIAGLVSARLQKRSP